MGDTVNRKRIQRLMRLMDLRALYPRQRTSQPGKGHKIYPYLLRDLCIERADPFFFEGSPAIYLDSQHAVRTVAGTEFFKVQKLPIMLLDFCLLLREKLIFY